MARRNTTNQLFRPGEKRSYSRDNSGQLYESRPARPAEAAGGISSVSYPVGDSDPGSAH